MRGAPLFLGLLLLGGCGYQTGSMMPDGISDLAVEMPKNESRYRDLESAYMRVLTRELVRRAQVRIRDPKDAQALLRATIKPIRRRPMVQGNLDELFEGGVFATVVVELVDPQTLEPLMAPFELRRRAEHIPARGESLRFALDEVMAELAEDSVNRIQAASFLGPTTRR